MDKSEKIPGEFKLLKTKSSVLHQAKMPENFRYNVDPKVYEGKQDPYANIFVKRNSETKEYILEDNAPKKPSKLEDQKINRYKGNESKQTQKFMICYRKNNEIMFCKLSSTIVFKKDVTITSSTTEITKKGRKNKDPSKQDKKKGDEQDDVDKFDDDEYEDDSEYDSDESLSERQRKRRKKLDLLIDHKTGEKKNNPKEQPQNMVEQPSAPIVRSKEPSIKGSQKSESGTDDDDVEFDD